MQSIFDSLEHGAVLLTSTRRLSRVLRQRFTSWQRDSGRTVWRSPAILPFDAYIAQLWNESLAREGGAALLLTREQQALVWEDIIRDSPEAESLLQIDATAHRAMEAWALIHAYRLPLDGRYQASADCESFLGWARAFNARSAAEGWLDTARLPNFIGECFQRGAISRPHELYYTGFDELSPQQRDVMKAAGGAELPVTGRPGATQTTVCPTAEDEIRCAAAWARATLEENPAAQIGVVVPDLSQQRSRIERIFRDVLGTDAAFHISLGQPLDKYPMLYAGLECIAAGIGNAVPLTRLGLVLRSPFLHGAAEERTARAALDARLRRVCRSEVSFDHVLQHCSDDCRILGRAISRMKKLLSEAGGLREHAYWSRLFSMLLRAAGWPGDRPLDSREHQLLRRWTELLSEFAALDAVAPPLTAPQAIGRLRALAARTIFQFEDPGAPVQISDHLETAGVHFDQLWVMGLHDEALPAAADPNPFLPVALQWEYGIPNSSAEYRRRTARAVFDRLLSSAARVVLSYPATDADRALSPSPLLTATARPQSPAPLPWIQHMRETSEMEALIDEVAPPLRDEVAQRGGASLIRDIAACPFRAFASHRLGARTIQPVEAGLTASDKGKAVHQALQLIWSEIGSHATLRTLTEAELSCILDRHIHAVLQPFGASANLDAERIRLTRLLTRWMQLERSRPPFTVIKLEEKSRIGIGGLYLDVRADRVDQLEDGRQVIIDYKTGDVKAKGWSGERLDEPQVPLYCISSEAPVAAAVFARIQAEAVGFAGIAETPLPGLQSWADRNGAGLDEHFIEWRRALQQLAQQFRAGDARVDPKNPGTCDYCDIVPLCRIRES